MRYGNVVGPVPGAVVVIEIGRMQLLYQGKSSADLPAGKLGVYLGGGNGLFDGEKLNGDVRWHLFENQDDPVCDAHFVGEIGVANGDNILFEMLGYFRRMDQTAIWRLVSATSFRTANGTYACFDRVIGMAIGTFDMNRYRHDYRLFAASCDE